MFMSIIDLLLIDEGGNNPEIGDGELTQTSSGMNRLDDCVAERLNAIKTVLGSIPAACGNNPVRLQPNSLFDFNLYNFS